MLLQYKNGVVYVISDYSEKSIASSAHFKWFPEKKFDDMRCWWTEDANNAIKLKEYADRNLQGYLKGLEVGRKRPNTDIKIEAPIGLRYMDFQVAGIQNLLGWSNTLLGDEMGTGKSISAIGYINANDSVESVLLVCPAGLKSSWRDELNKLLYRPMTIGIIEPKGEIPSTDIVIINYDIVYRFIDKLQKRHWDLQVADECQKIKNPKTRRAQAVLSLLSDRALFLTGTPIPNRVQELWPILKRLDPITWHDFFSFGKKYCGGKEGIFGWDFSGASNLAELQQILRSTIMVRRLKKDVLTELPEKIRKVIPIPAKDFQQLLRKEQNIFSKWESKLEDLEVDALLARASDSTEVYQEAAHNLRQGNSQYFEELSLLRHETALNKIPYVLEHAETSLESVDKIVIFAHHKDVLHKIADGLKEYGVVAIDGDTTLTQRQERLQQFQNNPDVRVLVAGILVAVGYTATAASTEIFAEVDWSPGNMNQAEDRCHRIGQKDCVLIYHIIVEDSIESKMLSKLLEKQEIISAALDDEVQELENTPLSGRNTTFRVLRTKLTRMARAFTEEKCTVQLRRLQKTDLTNIPSIERRVLTFLAGCDTLSSRQAALVEILLGG